MTDSFGLPVPTSGERFVFGPNSPTDSAAWHAFALPRRYGMAFIMVMGSGGGGGSGAIGAASSAGGGAGGGTGGLVVIDMPIRLLPSVIYLSVATGKTGDGNDSYVCAYPDSAGDHTIIKANRGQDGGPGSGATGGTGGTGGATINATAMRLGWGFLRSNIAGTDGANGGGTGVGNNVTIPTTGLRCTPGAGGGGLPAAATAGRAGGNITGLGGTSPFPTVLGGPAQSTATSPANPGQHGIAIPDVGFSFYGGTGGSSTHGSATGGGLVQGAGGNGVFPGCGGGGSGGALTGSSAAADSYGGIGFVMIVCY